jgi:hypothetical protein
MVSFKKPVFQEIPMPEPTYYFMRNVSDTSAGRIWSVAAGHIDPHTGIMTEIERFSYGPRLPPDMAAMQRYNALEQKLYGSNHRIVESVASNKATGTNLFTAFVGEGAERAANKFLRYLGSDFNPNEIKSTVANGPYMENLKSAQHYTGPIPEPPLRTVAAASATTPVAASAAPTPPPPWQRGHIFEGPALKDLAADTRYIVVRPGDLNNAVATLNETVPSYVRGGINYNVNPVQVNGQQLMAISSANPRFHFELLDNSELVGNIKHVSGDGYALNSKRLATLATEHGLLNPLEAKSGLLSSFARKIGLGKLAEKLGSKLPFVGPAAIGGVALATGSTPTEALAAVARSTPEGQVMAALEEGRVTEAKIRQFGNAANIVPGVGPLVLKPLLEEPGRIVQRLKGENVDSGVIESVLTVSASTLLEARDLAMLRDPRAAGHPGLISGTMNSASWLTNKIVGDTPAATPAASPLPGPPRVPSAAATDDEKKVAPTVQAPAPKAPAPPV